MALNDRNDNNNEPFVLDDTAEVRDDLTVGESQGALVRGTVLGEVSITVSGGYTVGDLVVCDKDAVDGSQYPTTLLADVSLADSASQSTGVSGYTRGLFDENQLVFAAGTDIDDLVAVDALIKLSMRDALRQMGLRVAPGFSLTGYENT